MPAQDAEKLRHAAHAGRAKEELEKGLGEVQTTVAKGVVAAISPQVAQLHASVTKVEELSGRMDTAMKRLDKMTMRVEEA